MTWSAMLYYTQWFERRTPGMDGEAGRHFCGLIKQKRQAPGSGGCRMLNYVNTRDRKPC